MDDRKQLISRKEAVRSRLMQLRSELDRERLRGSRGSRKVRQLEGQIDQLENEERELRLSIDRTAPEEPAASGKDGAGA